jgi:cytochrome c5
VLAAEPQRAGDAARGWDALVNNGYVGCGAPRALYDRFAGGAPDAWRLPGRTGRGADLPYFANAYTAPSGVEVVTANCLGCHASFLRGQLVVGLGDAAADFTMDVTPMIAAGAFLPADAAQKAELNKLLGRVKTLAPYMRTRTVGANPADHIAAVLFAHRDPQTLAWSDAPLIELPSPEPIPVDVPAWWLLQKKTAMFHTGAGRGDQARIMMTASVLCVDDVAAARAVDAYFPDIRAFILSLEPPPFPDELDAALATSGKAVFERRCSKCHGTYGPDGRYETRVIPLARVRTDPLLAEHAGQFAAPFRAWFNDSFYGEVARLEPHDGYVAPPLDGVWATAPYLHNGSIPTLAALLDSSLRKPRAIIGRGRDAYDLDAVGWTSYDVEANPTIDPRWIYDASVPGYSNAGHTFGDTLGAADRRALLEYLKSL